MTTPVCSLCGIASPDVRVLLVRWAEPPHDVAPFASLPRCRDAKACRERVERDGFRWPVQDPSKGRLA